MTDQRLAEKPEPPESRHFPPVVREWLKLAARLPKAQDRVEAIELAEKMARRNYPQFFRSGEAAITKPLVNEQERAQPAPDKQ